MGQSNENEEGRYNIFLIFQNLLKLD